MTAYILKRVGLEPYLRNDFEYGIGHLKKAGHDALEGSEKYHGYPQVVAEETVYVVRHFDFVRIRGQEDWRRATDPDSIGAQMGVLAVTNVGMYGLTTVKRVYEAVVLMARVFFDTFCTLYPQKNEVPFSKLYVEALNHCLEKKKKEFQALWKEIRRDFYYAAVMELAAVHAFLNHEDATRMQFLFADMECEWNHRVALESTATYGGTKLSTGAYKAFTSMIWMMMVHKCKPDKSLVASRILHQRPDLKNPIQTLENMISRTKGGRITDDEIRILREIIEGSDEFKGMTTEQLIDSTKLKVQFLMGVVKGLPKTHWVQYQCAYPFSAEKQGRIEVMPKTIAATFQEAQAAHQRELEEGL
ncbi:MAG: hypothetical protein KDK64_06340 [Chlamydiia bacterium]|nr:hypothetical protein [Chlamydiia bacterium]